MSSQTNTFKFALHVNITALPNYKFIFGLLLVEVSMSWIIEFYTPNKTTHVGIKHNKRFHDSPPSPAIQSGS